MAGWHHHIASGVNIVSDKKQTEPKALPWSFETMP